MKNEKKSTWSASTSETWPHYSDVSGSVRKIYELMFVKRFEAITPYNGQYFVFSSTDFLTNLTELRY